MLLSRSTGISAVERGFPASRVCPWSRRRGREIRWGPGGVRVTVRNSSVSLVQVGRWVMHDDTAVCDPRANRLDGEREAAILRAVYEMLGEVGYAGLRFEAVAARAKASKATLYRHWRGKAQIAVDAVRVCHASADAMPDTGT